MPRPKFHDVNSLLTNLALPFYLVDRDMAVPGVADRLENNAEHSWTLALAVCALAPEVDSNIDVGKASMLAVVHDLVEVYAGDTSVWASQESLSTKHAREQQALKKIKREFPQFPSLLSLIDEYESKASEEATFVWALDKFMAMLTLYADKGKRFNTLNRTIEQFREIVAIHKHKAHAHPEVGKYYDELMDAFEKHPEYFFKKQ